MFEIPVWDLLNSYNWDSKELEFSWDVYDWFYEEIKFLSPLEMKLKIIWTENWITVIFEYIKTKILYEDKITYIDLSNIDREFREKYEVNNPDDIKYIDMKKSTIDLKDIIKEEILIQCID